MIFSEKEWLRYTRHIQLEDFGTLGQTKLKNAHVLIIGLGGLGCPVSLYLAAAGVGQLTLVDGDVVEVTNLQRQILYGEEDVGKSKSVAAKHRLNALNSEIAIDSVPSHFTAENRLSLYNTYDLVLDCTDNFSARYLINDFCLQYNFPWIYAGINQFSGQCALFTQGKACFRCLFPEAPEQLADCNGAGVLGVLPGILGLLQATETIKYLVGLETPLANNLMLFDALNYNMKKIRLSPNKDCKCQRSDHLSEDIKTYPLSCEANTSPLAISATEFKRISGNPTTTLIDVRSQLERDGFHVGGSHIPLDELAYHINLFSPARTYLCYCQSGSRSMKAAQRMCDIGLNARSLSGGLEKLLQEHPRPLKSRPTYPESTQ